MSQYPNILVRFRGMLSRLLGRDTEFFVPRLGVDVRAYLDAGDKQGVHHVGRYQWAAKVFSERPPKRLLDVACGAGYGAWMLAQSCPGTEIVAVDYDERAIRYARRHYAAEGLVYRVGDMVTWRFDDGSPMGDFDAVCSFDTIEHLLHREIALMRLAEHLHDDGLLLLSTPCHRGDSRLNPGWEHHKIEYSDSDLLKLLSRFFAMVHAPGTSSFPAADFWRDVINADGPMYRNRNNPLVCGRPIRVQVE